MIANNTQPTSWMRTTLHSRDGKGLGAFDSPREAYDAAPDGAVLTLPPGQISISSLAGSASDDGAKNSGTWTLGKPITIRGTTRVSPMFGQGVLQNLTTIVGMPDSDNPAMLFVANGAGIGSAAPRSGVVIERLRIRPDRMPEPLRPASARRSAENIDCIRVRGGDMGTITRADIIDCELMNAGAGVSTIISQFQQSDNELFVRIEGCHIHDNYASRELQPDGTYKKLSHAHGIYIGGGTVSIINNLIERVGYVRGSTIFVRSNKDQGIYGERGLVTVTGNTISDVSHCAYQYRGINVTSMNNIADLCPIGFAFGSLEQAQAEAAGRGTRAIVRSTSDVVRRPVAFPDRVDGSPTLSCAFAFDYANSITMRGCRASGEGGIRGNWAAMQFGNVENTHFDVDGVAIEHWEVAVGHSNPLPKDKGLRQSFRRITTRHCRVPMATRWRAAGDLVTKVGGTWEGCELGAEAGEVL